MDRGTYVRLKLTEFRLPQTWLAKELEKEGISADASEISKALSGALTTPKASVIVSKSVEIINRYEDPNIRSVAVKTHRQKPPFDIV